MRMTEKQYKDYEKIRAEIEPLKDFLFWCGNKYHCPSVSNYNCRIITKLKRFLIGRTGYGCIPNEEVELPRVLQLKIIQVIEDYVAEKEKEMEEL